MQQHLDAWRNARPPQATGEHLHAELVPAAALGGGRTGLSPPLWPVPDADGAHGVTGCPHHSSRPRGLSCGWSAGVGVAGKASPGGAARRDRSWAQGAALPPCSQHESLQWDPRGSDTPSCRAQDSSAGCDHGGLSPTPVPT